VTLQTARVAAPEAGTFRPSRTRAKWAIVLVGISTWALILSGVTVAQGLAIVDDPSSTSASGIAEWEAFSGAANGLYIVALVASGIAFFAWLWRVVDNIPSLGGGQPSISPLGAIGWWFVPGANLFKPYQIVADVWRRLGSTSDDRRTRFVVAWWVAWVGGTLAGWLLGWIEPTTIADLRGVLILTTIAIALQVLGGIFLIRIVSEVERRIRFRAESAPVIATAPTPTSVVDAPSANGPNVGRKRIAFCPFCGTERIETARFCSSCGASLDL
jgi:hypothetical protein